MAEGRLDNKRVRSVYLDKTEWAAAEQIARANGISSNAVIRIGFRRLLDVATVDLRVPDDVREQFGAKT